VQFKWICGKIIGAAEDVRCSMAKVLTTKNIPPYVLQMNERENFQAQTYSSPDCKEPVN
jgi:hypothetical protein